MGVDRVGGVKREGEAGILERSGMLKTETFSPLFPFFSLLARPSRSHVPNSRVLLPLLKLPPRLLLGDEDLLLLSGF